MTATLNNMKVLVPAERLDGGLWLKEGGLSLRLSGMELLETVAMSFTHDNKSWVSIGSSGSLYQSTAHCYELLPASLGTSAKVPYSYEGEDIIVNGKPYRLGVKHEFVSLDPTVAQWSKLLHAMYSKGGMFTSGKTYHDFLRDTQDHDLWEVDTQEYVSAMTVVPNLYQTITLELAKPDWSKHTHIELEAVIQPEPETFTLEQIALAFE